MAVAGRRPEEQPVPRHPPTAPPDVPPGALSAATRWAGRTTWPTNDPGGGPADERTTGARWPQRKIGGRGGVLEWGGGLLTRPPRRPPQPPSRTQSRARVTWAVPGTGSAAVAWVARCTTLYPPSRPLAMRLAGQPPRWASGWWGTGGRGSRKELSSSIGPTVAEAGRAGTSRSALNRSPLNTPQQPTVSRAAKLADTVRHLLLRALARGRRGCSHRRWRQARGLPPAPRARTKQTAVGLFCTRPPH